MDDRERHAAIDYAKLVIAFAALIFAVCFALLVLWIALSKQDSKLYEADGVVCVSQPFALQCFERKTRP